MNATVQQVHLATEHDRHGRDYANDDAEPKSVLQRGHSLQRVLDFKVGRPHDVKCVDHRDGQASFTVQDRIQRVMGGGAERGGHPANREVLGQAERALHVGIGDASDGSGLHLRVDAMKELLKRLVVQVEGQLEPDYGNCDNGLQQMGRDLHDASVPLH